MFKRKQDKVKRTATENKGIDRQDSDQTMECTAGAGMCIFVATSRPALGPTQPPVQSVPRGRGISLRLKRAEREANNSLPSSAQVKNAWSYTSTVPQTTSS
jgi:hypothetical protein